ncbi:MAG: MarR family transcriptional regulator [Chloroflexi bacterium]|nr:MarR family transcriptional regulator [Chloroflexota bacterium]
MVNPIRSDDPTLLELRRLGRLAERLLSRALTDAGLTPDQLQVLLMVAAQPGVSAVACAQALDLDAPTVSRLVNGLAQSGLLDRRRARSDRRMVRLRLTPAGRRLAEEGRAAVATANQEVVEELRPAERRALRRALERLFSASSS